VEYEKAIAKSKSFESRKIDANEFFAAEALFRLTEIKYGEFAEIRFKLPQAQMEVSKERKKNALLEIVDNYTKVAAYGTLRLYESTYKIGATYEEFASTWAEQEIPEVDAARRIVAKKEINQTAAELYERSLLAYKNAAKALAKLASLYYNQAAQVYATADTALFDSSGRVAAEDTTLRIAQRWIERSKLKISEVIYDMAEINYASVEQLLEAPVPENMDKITALEFHHQLLGKFIKPLIAQIVAAHQRNLTEADSLSLNNLWVDKSRRKIITTENILAAEYADLSWRALSQYKADISDYKAYVNSGDVRALDLRDEMGNLVDYSRSFAKATVQAHGGTFDRAAAIQFTGSELKKTEEAAFAFAYRFATSMDSLAKIANAERQAFEARIKQGDTGNGSEGLEAPSAALSGAVKGDELQDAAVAFEDNYYSLSEGVTEVLQLGFELAQKHKLENAWSEKIVLMLVKSQPEKYASLLGLQLAQLSAPTDETWLATPAYRSGWTNVSFSTSEWRAAQNLGEGQQFKGYGAQRLWLSGDSAATLNNDSPVDSTAGDSVKTPPAPKKNNLLYFRKSLTVAGLPVSGQIQLLADDSYNLFVNGEYIAEFNKPANEAPGTRIHDLSNFLHSGENTIALEVRDQDNSGGALEAVVFVKSLPGWEQREAELQAKKEKREEMMIFERGVLPIFIERVPK
jgi:hypothetical protein